jgi:hypothetical protein
VVASIRINARPDEKTYRFFLNRAKKRINVVAIRVIGHVADEFGTGSPQAVDVIQRKRMKKKVCACTTIRAV